MGELLNIVTPLHRRSARDYFARMTSSKPAEMEVACRYGHDYWDGDRRFGYGGYRYDGRWRVVAEQLIERYGLGEGASILDVGCGKGYLLYEFQQLLPGAEVVGFDLSAYALANAKPEIQGALSQQRAQDPYPYGTGQFDLVVSLGVLHNLRLPELKGALAEIERVGRHGYVMVESYRDLRELTNLQCWALTANSFFAHEEWVWLFDHFGYRGDYEFIYFE